MNDTINNSGPDVYLPCIRCNAMTIGRIKRAHSKEALVDAPVHPYCKECLAKDQFQFEADKEIPDDDTDEDDWEDDDDDEPSNTALTA